MLSLPLSSALDFISESLFANDGTPGNDPLIPIKVAIPDDNGTLVDVDCQVQISVDQLSRPVMRFVADTTTPANAEFERFTTKGPKKTDTDEFSLVAVHEQVGKWCKKAILRADNYTWGGERL